jgi:hypothetical protein
MISGIPPFQAVIWNGVLGSCPRHGVRARGFIALSGGLAGGFSPASS